MGLGDSSVPHAATRFNGNIYSFAWAQFEFVVTARDLQNVLTLWPVVHGNRYANISI